MAFLPAKFIKGSLLTGSDEPRSTDLNQSNGNKILRNQLNLVVYLILLSTCCIKDPFCIERI